MTRVMNQGVEPGTWVLAALADVAAPATIRYYYMWLLNIIGYIIVGNVLSISLASPVI